MGSSQSTTVTVEDLQRQLESRQNVAPGFLTTTMPKLAKLCSLIPAPPTMVLGTSISVIISIKNFSESNTIEDPKVRQALSRFFNTADLLRTTVGEFSKVTDYSEQEKKHPPIVKVLNDLAANIQTLSESLRLASESIYIFILLEEVIPPFPLPTIN